MVPRYTTLLLLILFSSASLFDRSKAQDDPPAGDTTVAGPDAVDDAATSPKVDAATSPKADDTTIASTADDAASTAADASGTAADGTGTPATGDASPTPSPSPSPTPATDPDACVKNASLVSKLKRECRSSCSDTKKCKNSKATCQCDGPCGKVCITPDVKCKKPSDIEHGKVSTLEGLLFGNAAVYSCEPEYEIVGSEERYCQGDGKWSEDEPFCTPEGSRCEPPVNEVENSTIVFSEEGKTEFFVGDYAVYKCDEGFYPDGEVKEIECITTAPKEAQWSPVNITCLPNPCQPLEQIANGTVSGDNFTFGDTATYKCNPGYAMVGEGELQCQSDGTWTGRVPECQLPDITCTNIPDDPENGVVSFDPELYGRVVYYKCDAGYKINGTEYRECINDGEWSGNDTVCTAIDCGEPETPENGTIIFKSGTEWSKQVDYSCNEDTTAMGPTSAECQEDGTWSNPPPTCLSHCLVVEIENGFFVSSGVTSYEKYNMIPSGVLLPHNTSAQVACDKNYEMPSTGPTMQNHGDIECSNGTWAPSSQCVPARCFCDDLKYNKLHERNFTLARDCLEPTAHGAEVLLKCEPDFPEMVKKGILKCEIGEWKYPEDPDEICRKRSCSVKEITLEHGKMYKNQQEWEGDPGMTEHGTELRFECTEEGYELYVDQTPVNHPSSNVNFTIRTCDNGVWSSRMPVCRPARCMCNNLTANLSDRGLETSECEELASSGDFVQMTCAGNYSKPTGPLVAECQLGQWKPFDTECLKMCSCDDLRANMSESLQAECTGAVDNGTAIEMECGKGYVNMTGSPSAECQEGLWIMDETFCNATEDVPPKESLQRDCKYSTTGVSSQVVAFYQGKFLINNSPVPHSANITLRCSNVQNLKFVGNRRLQCIDGKFDSAMPECRGLLPDSDTSAPPLWLTTYPPDYPKVNEEGVLIIPKHSAISITCWYHKSKPDIEVKADVQPKSQQMGTFGNLVGWTTAFDRISDITTLNYSCGIPGKTPKEDFTQYLDIKVADTCRLQEQRIESYGLLVNPETRRYLFSENEQVELICGGLVDKYFPYMTCKEGGRWEFAQEIECPVQEDTTTEDTVLTTR